MSAQSFPESPESGGPAEVASGAFGPTRTCVGCRQAAPAAHLVRVVLQEGVLVPAPRRGRTGRGAWVHPSPACLSRAVKARAFDRAFRVSVHSVDAESLARTLGLSR